ncbi:hypothetical protein [Cytobacillus gottheilii]|uniref:hypothetical protein n=1 Tax=Cytobacillus gottheilii TaxID=859144 RepID=UPI0012E98860|nr:hypothetical protein [Cytobacillus gottheilii]
MGTSKGYSPPTGHLWSDTKRAVSGMARNNYSPDSIGKAMSNFSKANRSNGSGKEGNSAIGASGTRAINFSGLVRNFGLDYALNEVGLSIITRSPCSSSQYISTLNDPICFSVSTTFKLKSNFSFKKSMLSANHLVKFLGSLFQTSLTFNNSAFLISIACPLPDKKYLIFFSIQVTKYPLKNYTSS